MHCPESGPGTLLAALRLNVQVEPPLKKKKQSNKVGAA